MTDHEQSEIKACVVELMKAIEYESRYQRGLPSAKDTPYSRNIKRVRELLEPIEQAERQAKLRRRLRRRGIDEKDVFV